MYEAIFGLTLMGLGVALIICGCCSKRRGSKSTGCDTDPVRDGLERAGDNNKRLEDAERTTEERLEEQAGTIERAAEGNRQGQELVQKAKSILANARHTD